jgi:hypothetical protein
MQQTVLMEQTDEWKRLPEHKWIKNLGLYCDYLHDLLEDYREYGGSSWNNPKMQVLKEEMDRRR